MKKLLIFTLIFIFVITGCSKTADETDLRISMENQISIPSIVDGDIDLPESITFEDEVYEVIWESSDDDIIDVTGQVKQPDEESMVTLRATVTTQTLTHTMIFEARVMRQEKANPFLKNHQFVQYSKNVDSSKLNHLKLVNEKLEIEDGQTAGSYVSEAIESSLFTKLVGSWAAISSTNATVELQVRVMVDGVWSTYLSYRPWGFGKNNFSLDASDHIAKISIDEVVILNDKQAQKFQYKVILERLDVSTPSPKLELISFALTMPDYTYEPNVDNLPDFVDYEVPLLNQQEVPNVGSSICSPTSAAMLLLYKGHDLYTEDEIPHRYIAGLFRDYGAHIYGNWVFNTVGMSSYNETAYVGMMYSFEELMKHLVEVGPVAASVSGDMGLYTTGGHLIVVRGYKITESGDILVLVNDPNINSRFGNDGDGQPLFVYYELPLETFMNTWKGIVYIIE